MNGCCQFRVRVWASSLRLLIVGIEAVCISSLLLNPVRMPSVLIPSCFAGCTSPTASPMHSISLGFSLANSIVHLYSLVLCSLKGSSGMFSSP